MERVPSNVLLELSGIPSSEEAEVASRRENPSASRKRSATEYCGGSRGVSSCDNGAEIPQTTTRYRVVLHSDFSRSCGRPLAVGVFQAGIKDSYGRNRGITRWPGGNWDCRKNIIPESKPQRGKRNLRFLNPKGGLGWTHGQ